MPSTPEGYVNALLFNGTGVDAAVRSFAADGLDSNLMPSGKSKKIYSEP